MNLRHEIVESLRGYLDSTTIHGFSYLGASKNVIERIAWIFIIGTCFTLAGVLITKSIEDANENPILTTFETVSVKDVPFPSVTIDSGEPDQWEPSAKVFNSLAFESTGHWDLPESEALRQAFSPFIDEFVNKS